MHKIMHDACYVFLLLSPLLGFVFPKEIFGISVWYYVGGGGGKSVVL